jgi:hypothetical protein
MGATWCETQLEADDRTAATAEFRNLCEQAAYEHGHGGYSGTFAEKLGHGVVFRPGLYPTRENARHLLQRDASKWGAALAVRVRGYGGWMVGGWCSE